MARSIIIDGIERTGVIARIGSRFTSAAFMGQSALSEVVLEDLTGAAVDHLDVAALKIVSVVEDATASPTTIFRGRVGSHSVLRGDHRIGSARNWQLRLQDYNWDLRGFRNLGWFRPAETDVERVQALRLAFLDGADSSSPRRRTSTALSGTYISTDNPVDLPAKRYTDYELEAILREIAEFAGKTYFVTVDGELFYDLHSSTAYAASLAVDPDLADGETVFAPLAGIEAFHGGQEILTGGAMRYGDEQKNYVEGSDVFLGESFHDKWEGVLSSGDIEDEAEAQAYFEQIIKYRTNEDITYSFTLSLRADQVDLIKPGQALTIRHPAVDADANQDLRIVQLQYEPDAPAHYLVHVELGYPRVPPPRRNGVRRKATPSVSLAEPIVTTEPAISFVGCISKTAVFPASVTLRGSDLPADAQPGDVAVVQACDDGTTEIPTIPSPWTAIGAGGIQHPSLGYRGAYLVLTQELIDDETGWDFGFADSVLGGVYRGVDASDPIGAIAGADDNSNVVDIPGLTLEVTDGTSWVFIAAHHGSAGNTSSGSITGATVRCSARSGEHGHWDTNGGVASWSAASFGVSSSTAWQSHAFELKADPGGVSSSGDTNEDGAGTSSKGARADHRHGYLRESAPTSADNASRGYRTGDIWLVVDDEAEATNITAIYYMIDEQGVWDTFGGGTALIVQEGDSTVVAVVSALDFGAGIDVTEAPSGEANIALDLSEVTTFTDHSARHEDGGADEISIAGLSGTPAALTAHEADPDAHHPASGSLIYLPLTTVVAGEPELVWDGDDSLIPTGSAP